MSFLNPFALFGLFAAAIPVLLHMLAMRRLRTIEFSTLRFLKELQRTRIRRLKLRQILLLVLRTLLVVFLVLAFSRPTLRGIFGSSAGGHARSTMVIILDDTPSMTAAGSGGELFSQARSAAGRMIDLLEEGDEAVLLPVSMSDAPDLPAPTTSAGFLRSTLNGLRPASRTRTLETSLRVAARILGASRNFNKEIYLFSDVQASTLEANTSAPPERLFDARTRLYVLPLQTGEIRNASVQDVLLPDAIREPGRSLTVRVRVANSGTHDLKNRIVSLFINGVRTAQRGIDIPAGGSAEAEFASAPMRPGFASGMAELEDDDLEFDNRRYFSLFIPSEIRVLCVGTPADVAYVEMALSARLADTLQFVRLDRVAADRITRAGLMAQDVIVLCDPGPLSAESSAAVAEFVRNGGGMILFPGLRTDPRSYSVSFGALSLPAIVGIDRAVAPGGGAALPFTFGRVDWQHPIFQRMFESDRGKTTLRSDGSGRRPLESPDVRTTMRFLPGPHSSVVIELSNGAPFLIDQPAGNGRSLLFSVPATRSWSDLPTRGIFVTALHRAVLYAARKTHDAPPVNAGDPARITLQEASAPHASVTDPGGVRSDLPLTRTANGLVLALPSTDRPGLYRIQAGGNVEDLVAVNVDARESALAAAGESRLEGLFRRLGIEPGAVTTVGSGERLTRAVLDARIGTELWRLFLVLALVTALAETAVARDSRRALADIKHEMTGQVT